MSLIAPIVLTVIASLPERHWVRGASTVARIRVEAQLEQPKTLAVLTPLTALHPVSPVRPALIKALEAGGAKDIVVFFGIDDPDEGGGWTYAVYVPTPLDSKSAMSKVIEHLGDLDLTFERESTNTLAVPHLEHRLRVRVTDGYVAFVRAPGQSAPRLSTGDEPRREALAELGFWRGRWATDLDCAQMVALAKRSERRAGRGESTVRAMYAPEHFQPWIAGQLVSEQAERIRLTDVGVKRFNEIVATKSKRARTLRALVGPRPKRAVLSALSKTSWAEETLSSCYWPNLLGWQGSVDAEAEAALGRIQLDPQKKVLRMR